MGNSAEMMNSLQGPLMDRAVEVAVKMASSTSNIEKIGDTGFVVVRIGTPEFMERDNGIRFPVIPTEKGQDFGGIGFYVFEESKA